MSALAEIKRAGHAAVEVHTHPGADHDVAFSHFDEQELPRFARYVQNKIPGRPFGALVFGRCGYDGRVFDERGSMGPLGLEPVGEWAAMPRWLAARCGEEQDRVTEEPAARFDRQIRALGPDGQERLERLNVGVVGLGGTGSQVVQHLAHLGVKRFVLVDDDRIESTNLHRLAGGTRSDVFLRRRKTAIARRTVRRISSGREVRRFGDVRSPSGLDALKTVDVIVGCVDNDGARMIMTEVAAAYLIPYLDIGVGIEQTGPRAIGGRASFFIPGGPCLACADDLDFAEAAEDLETEAARTIRRVRGYGRDREVEAALMPLNSVVAATAIFELLAFVTGIDRVAPSSGTTRLIVDLLGSM